MHFFAREMSFFFKYLYFEKYIYIFKNACILKIYFFSISKFISNHLEHQFTIVLYLQ